MTAMDQDQVVDEPLNQDELQVEQIATNQFIEASELPFFARKKALRRCL